MTRPINPVSPRIIKMLTAAAVAQKLMEPRLQSQVQLATLQLLSLTTAGIDLRDKLNSGAKASAAANGAAGVNGTAGAGGEEPPQGPIEKLEKLGLRNITTEAREGRLDPVFERSKEMSELSKRLKGGNNAILIGDTGVGKTAVVEGLAQEWKDEQKTYFFSLGMKDLDRSVLEPQLKMIVETVQEAFRQGFTIYILMDELHLHVQAGVLELLKEPLGRPGFQVIGATTTGEFYKYFNDDATKRRFGDTIRIEALSGDKLRRLVRNIIPVILERLKGAEKIDVPPRSRQAAIELSPLIIGRFPPDATIALLKDAIGSKRSQLGDLRRLVAEGPKILADDINDLIEYSADASTRSQIEGIWKSIIAIVSVYLESEAMVEKVSDELTRTGCFTITEDDIRAQASKMSGLDLRKLDELDIQQLSQIENRIRTRLVGQDIAVEKVAGAIKRYKAGRRKKQSPIASFLFTGPTGTGKTEMAHTLAWLLFGDAQRVMTVDLSKCNGKGGKTLLFGPDPGFVGFDKTEGMLPELLKRKENRHGVLFLDEIDKADREVYESLLTMLDQGYVQNKKTGEKYMLEDIVVIMASNQGEAQMLKPKQIKELAETRLREQETKLGEEMKAAKTALESIQGLDDNIDAQKRREIDVLQAQLDELRTNRSTHLKTIMGLLIENNRKIAAGSFKNQADEYGREKYPPAFMGRLELIPFDYLIEDNLAAIADIQLKNFISQVERDQKLDVVIGGSEAEYLAIKQYLLGKGTDLVQGARPLKTAIENFLDNPFSAWFVNTMPSGENIIKVVLKDGVLTFEESAEKSKRGRQMDIPNLRGRKGIILRAIKELVAKEGTVEANQISTLLAPPKGKERVELFFDENPLPEGPSAAAEALAKLKKSLGAEDLEALKNELFSLLRTDNPGILAMALSLAADVKPLKEKEHIASLFTHPNAYVAQLAKAAFDKLEETTALNTRSGEIILSAGDKNKADPKVSALLAGISEFLADKHDEVRFALNTLIYIAKERQEKLADGSKRDLPLIVRWNIIEDRIAITVSCAANQPKDEENRLKQLREKKVKGASANLKIAVSKMETSFTYSIFKAIPPITISYSPLTNNNPTLALTPIIEAITAADPAGAGQIISALRQIIDRLGISALPEAEIKMLEKNIKEHVSKFNPNIRSFADVLNYSGWDESYKAELLRTLCGGPIPEIEVRFEKEPDKINLIFSITKPISAEIENSIAKIVASIKATAVKATHQKTGTVSLTVTINQE